MDQAESQASNSQRFTVAAVVSNKGLYILTGGGAAIKERAHGMKVTTRAIPKLRPVKPRLVPILRQVLAAVAAAAAAGAEAGRRAAAGADRRVAGRLRTRRCGRLARPNANRPETGADIPPSRGDQFPLLRGQLDRQP